jgi:NAD-dependent deacetylase
LLDHVDSRGRAAVTRTERTTDDVDAILRDARHVVVFTGAGVSAESGIPTFRDALTGLWERFDVAALASEEGFRRDPELVWGWYEWRRMSVMRAQPNAAHRAIAAVATKVPKLTLVTQNVDDLHERAGSAGALHLHGSLFAPRCLACGSPASLPSGIPEEPEGGRRVAPPRCSHCGGRVRPGVVWFGETLPEAVLQQACDAARSCDVLLSVGTSSLVYPAAQIPIDAHRAGAKVVQVNPNPTDLDGIADFNVRGTAATVLPALLQRAFLPAK